MNTQIRSSQTDTHTEGQKVFSKMKMYKANLD